MGDQPGAGNSRSYKIRGYTRERHSTKPYARPPERKSVLETVKDFFSPSWLVDFFKGNRQPETIRVEGDGKGTHTDSISKDFEPTTSGRSLSRSDGVFGTQSPVGNGQMKPLFAPGYFSSAFRQREVSSEIPTASKPLGTAGLSTGSVRYEQPSTGSRRSEKPETDVPGSSNEDMNMSKDSLLGEDNILTTVHRPVEERTQPGALRTSTPALFSIPSRNRRPRESSSEPSVETTSKAVFKPCLESRPQPFVLPKSRPSFSLSAFGSPLPPPQSCGLSSSFYQGRTSFGGASSFHSSGYKRIRTGSPSEREAHQPVRKQIKPKPVSTSGSGGLTSQTAKRILEALESMSSPLIDARKIPTPPVTPSASLLSFSPAKRKRPPMSSRTVGSPRSLQAHLSGPPVQDLSAPQRASISRPAEKASTLENMAVTSESLFSTATTTISTFSKPSVSLFIPTPLPISLSPLSSGARAGGKIKSARSASHYTKRGKQEDRGYQEEVNLLPEVTTAVPLHLPKGKSLPLFSFSSASHTRETDTDQESLSIDSVTKTADITKNNFKFSAPQPKLPSPSHPSSTASENSSNKITFSFSQPIPVSKSISRTTSNSVMNVEERIPNMKTKPIEKSVEPNNNLLKAFTPSNSSWTCDTCLVSNKATDLKCISCESSKPTSQKHPTKEVPPVNNDLFQKFAPLQGASNQQCVACQMPKPSTQSQGSSEDPAVLQGEDLMKKFAPPTGSWTCDSCMLINKSTDSSCVACHSGKPGASKTVTTSVMSVGSSTSLNSDKGLLAKFAPPAGSWCCDTCMISNKAENTSCVACETPKPGSKPSNTSPPTFGISSSCVFDKDLANRFAPPVGSWSCGTCMVDNKAENSSCSACQTPKPGAESSGKVEGSFKHGGEQAFSSTTFRFGFNKTEAKTMGDSSVSPSVSFRFGTSDAPTAETKGQSNSATLFKFGISSAVDQSSKSDPDNATSSNGKDKDKLPATFMFGTGTSGTKEEVSKSNAVSISFGISNHSSCSDKGVNKSPELSMGFKNPAEKDKLTSGGFSFGVTKDKPNSIATAAAAGLLKVPKVTPEGKEPVENVGEPSVELGSGVTIASAAKTGLLNVPAVGENKGDAVVPVNVNLFGSGSSSMKSVVPNVSKSSFQGFLPPSNPSTSGFSFAAPSGQASSFAFGIGQTVVPSSSEGPATAESNSTFSFGALSASKGGFSSSAPTTSAPAVPSFSFTPNVVPATSSSGSTPFQLAASSAAPVTASSVAAFSFTVPSVNATSTASTASAPLVQSAAPQALFSFGGNPGSAVSSSTTGHITQTFGVSSASLGGSSAEPAKPFSFNATSNSSSLQQGFSFGPASKPASASPFNFGGSAPKTNINFGGFGATQSSSIQPAANSPFLFGASTSNTPDETMDADGNNSSTPAGDVFGATGPPAASTFGSSGSSGGFSFGGQAAPATGGFNFGAAQQPNTAQSPFVFGAGGGTAPAFGASVAPRATAPAPGGFDFSGAAATMASPGGFNFGVGGSKPQGGGMFSAGTPGDPGNPAVAGRRFKKAVRRTKR